MSLVSLKHFPTLIKAEIARGKLDASGIACVLQRGPLPGGGSFVQDAEVFVEEIDRERALRILEG